MDWKDRDHPIWPLANLVVLMLALFGILYGTAHSFDFNEIIILVTAFLAAAGFKVAERTFTRSRQETVRNEVDRRYYEGRGRELDHLDPPPPPKK